MATMNVSSSTKKPVLQRSVAYGAPYAYEKLVEKNHSIHESSISLDLDGGSSLSTILLSLENNRSVSSSDDGCYSYSDIDSGDSDDDGGRLGATPSKMRGRSPSKKRGGFPSISPVKSSEDIDGTLDIPGLSDWSVDISRMSMPAMMTERTDDEAIAQDANTPTREETDVASEDSPNESSPQNDDAEITISLREQLESLGLRLESLEKAIFSDSDDLNRTSDVGNMAFIVEEEDSTVESLTHEITLLEAEEIENDSARKTRRSKQSLFVRFLFFGGCRKF